MRRNKFELLDHEVEILRAAFGSDEGVIPYRFARDTYGAQGIEKIANGSIYKRFRVLEEEGMLERGNPVVEGNAHARIPYSITVLGVVALSETVPDLTI